LSVYQRDSLLDGLAMYLSCDTKKFHDNESTHILHNFWTSTHRGKLATSPLGENRVKIRPVKVEIKWLSLIVKKERKKERRYRSKPYGQINKKNRYNSPIFLETSPWTDLHQIWHSRRGHRRNHLYHFLVIGLGVWILCRVENCHLPLTKPVAVNTGLTIPRSP